MRTLLKDAGVDQDSGIGNGDKWVDLKELMDLVTQIREMNRRQIQILWDLKLLELGSFSRNEFTV